MATPEAEPTSPTRLRITVAGLLVLVALGAVAFAVFRPRTTSIRDVKPGTGAAVRAGDHVVVHYVGKLADGTTFDDSHPRGEPAEFPIGTGQVIAGWDKGLIGMRVGGVRQLVVPASEGYGAQGSGMIPPGATLHFEIELLGIK